MSTSKTLCAAIYARISTSEARQSLETQLAPLTDYVAARGYELAGTWTDQAQATDLRRRTGWRALMQDAARRRFDLIVVARLDRAFRSISHATTTAEQLRRWGVALVSLAEPWADTSDASPVGTLVFNILSSVAEFEKALIRERSRPGWPGLAVRGSGSDGRRASTASGRTSRPTLRQAGSRSAPRLESSGSAAQPFIAGCMPSGCPEMGELGMPRKPVSGKP